MYAELAPVNRQVHELHCYTNIEELLSLIYQYCDQLFGKERSMLRRSTMRRTLNKGI